MIQIHAHLRDWYESHKETIKHGLDVLSRLGCAAVVDQPNSDPPVISEGLARLRLRDAYNCYSPVHYLLLMGVTSDPAQIREAVESVRKYPLKDGERVGIAGLKMFAGKSIGDLSVVDFDKQRSVFRTLSKSDYRGFIAAHCEKESEMYPGLWNPQDPISHCYARPEKSEIESHRDIIGLAIEEKFKGHLHLYHVTTPEAIKLVLEAKKHINITCGVTLHHLILDNEVMRRENGILYKVNPPLRSPETRRGLFECFLKGEVDVVESDHAPHSLGEKTGKVLGRDGKPQYLSGIPWFPWLLDAERILEGRGASRDLIERMNHNRINEILGTNIPRIKKGVKVIEGDDRDSYAFNPLESLS